MLIGGWSNTMSVIASRWATTSRSSLTGPLPCQQVAHRALQRDAGAVAPRARRQQLDRHERAHHPRHRIGDRRAGEAGWIVAGGPATVRLRRRSVPRTVAVDER